MGHAFTRVELRNPRQPELPAVAIDALADTGAAMLCIPEAVAVRLDLETQERRNVHLADGRVGSVPYVGPIEVRFERRRCFVGALVMGDGVLLGAVPMEDMDLVVNPRARSVTVNPASPDIARSRA